MKIIDRNTSETFGVDTAILMERASLEVVSEIEKWKKKREAKRQYRVLILSGTGNNGGDGACIGRILKTKGYRVTQCIIGDPTKSTDLLLKQLKIAEKYGVSTETFSNVRETKNGYDYDIIVDAIFGIGLTRPLLGDALEAVNYTNRCKKEMGKDLFVVSVDMPSGVSADTGQVMEAAVRADVTVTFNQVKIGQILYPGCEYCGELKIADAGITDESFLGKEPTIEYYDGEPLALLPERKKDSNKGTNGKVLIVAGSKDISGACVLAASACLKAGAGMVMIFTAAENAEAVKTLLPEAIVSTYEDFEPVRDKLLEAMKWSTQAVIGPGIGKEGKGKELLTVMLESYDKSLVMDADALNIIAGDNDLMKMAENFATGQKALVLTPHMGEFSRLVKKSIKECKEHLLENPRELALKLHGTVLCKDARSIVADSEQKKIYINISGNDGMATAGSGDVLSGIIGAFLLPGLTGYEAAIAGAYIHGRAGDKASENTGRYSMVATDIVSALPEILI